MNSFDLKWHKIQRDQKNIYRIKEPGGNELRGKYYQWRAHLIPSPDGKRGPSLSDLVLQYRIDSPPIAPVQVSALSGPSGSVILRWRKNLEQDLYGYKIYYGTRPGRYDGIITKIEGKEITNSTSTDKDRHMMQVAITNAIINENHQAESRQMFSFPLLNNKVLYYFAISAYDTYKPFTPDNHESRLSEPITVRVQAAQN